MIADAERISEARPLSRYPVLATSSLEEACDAVTRIYLPHRLTAASDRVDMTLNAVAGCRMTLGFLAYHANTQLIMPPTEDCYHFNLTTVGRTFADRTDGARQVTRANESGLVLSPDQRNTVRWQPDSEQLILKISRPGLESHLAELLGHAVAGVIDFDFGLDLSGPAGQSLLNAVKFLAAELDRPGGLADMPLARQQLEELVMTQLLYAGHHQYSGALASTVDALKFGRLAPVVEFIESHADEPLTPSDLARVGCMSVRTLHASFQQTFGETCMSYLRRIRLDHVRRELLRTDAQETRVIDVAMRWGFVHQSRFAQQYQERFGELPSATLRR